MFVQRPDSTPELGYYGIIELKRPQDPILKVYTERHIVPSGKLAQAVHQIEHYLDELKHGHQLCDQFPLVLGHARYSFLILGCKSEIVTKCRTEMQRIQFRNLMPAGIELVPYDSLLERFRRTDVPMLVMELMPQGSASRSIKEPKEFSILRDDDMGSREDYVTCLLTTRGRIRIPSGRYRQQFGIPRKVWPFEDDGVTRLVDNYYYELEQKLGPEGYAEFLEKVRGKDLPIEAHEIEGEFDSNGLTWKRGTTMKVFTKKQGFGSIEMDTWAFNCYQGDKLYWSDNSLYLSTAYPD